jgi:hypothetical protein
MWLVVPVAVVLALLTALTTYLKGRWGLIWYLLPLMVFILSVVMMGVEASSAWRLRHLHGGRDTSARGDGGPPPRRHLSKV